jgi:hypothetical protein
VRPAEIETPGMPSFDRIRYRQHDDSVFLYAFDLIELNGDDLRRDPLEVRKATLASTLAKAAPGIRFNEHLEGDGATVFPHACKLGLEGIVSKRLGTRYRSGRVAGLDQGEESGLCGGEARGGGGLGQREMAMNRENLEVVASTRARLFVGFSDDRRLFFFVLILFVLFALVIIVVRVARRQHVAHDDDEAEVDQPSGNVLRDVRGHVGS